MAKPGRRVVWLDDARRRPGEPGNPSGGVARQLLAAGVTLGYPNLTHRVDWRHVPLPFEEQVDTAARAIGAARGAANKLVVVGHERSGIVAAHALLELKSGSQPDGLVVLTPPLTSARNWLGWPGTGAVMADETEDEVLDMAVDLLAEAGEAVPTRVISAGRDEYLGPQAAEIYRLRSRGGPGLTVEVLDDTHSLTNPDHRQLVADRIASLLDITA